MLAGKAADGPWMARVANGLRNGLFEMAYRGSSDLPSMRRVAAVVLTIESLQTLAYPLHSLPPMPWTAHPAIQPLARALDFVNTVRADLTFGAFNFRALLGTALAWTSLFALAAVATSMQCVPTHRAHEGVERTGWCSRSPPRAWCPAIRRARWTR